MVTKRRPGKTGVCSAGGTGAQTCGRVLPGPQSKGLSQDDTGPHGEYQGMWG